MFDGHKIDSLLFVNTVNETHSPKNGFSFILFFVFIFFFLFDAHFFVIRLLCLCGCDATPFIRGQHLFRIKVSRDLKQIATNKSFSFFLTALEHGPMTIRQMAITNRKKNLVFFSSFFAEIFLHYFCSFFYRSLIHDHHLCEQQ